MERRSWPTVHVSGAAATVESLYRTMFGILGNQALGAEFRSRSVDRIRHPNRRPSDSALRSGELKLESRACVSLSVTLSKDA